VHHRNSSLWISLGTFIALLPWPVVEAEGSNLYASSIESTLIRHIIQNRLSFTKCFVSSVLPRYKIYPFIRSSRSRCWMSILSILHLRLNLAVCLFPSTRLTLSLISSSHMMDSFYVDQNSRTKDSHPPRSRSNSHLSATASQFQDLNIGSTVRSVDNQEGALSEAETTSTPSFLDPASLQPHQNSSNFISAPVPQQYTTFPLLSESVFDADWPYDISTEEQLGSTPVVRLDPVCASPRDIGDQSVGDRESFPRSDSISTANMR
jgi:hypothetical protein